MQAQGSSLGRGGHAQQTAFSTQVLGKFIGKSEFPEVVAETRRSVPRFVLQRFPTLRRGTQLGNRRNYGENSLDYGSLIHRFLCGCVIVAVS
jgi:hypothetical protein